MAPRQLPSLPQYRKDAVTRRLCASAHLDADFARQIRAYFTTESLHAVGLPLGINLVALVRHCRAAAARQDRLDHRLAWLFAGFLASLLVVLGGLVSGSSPAMLAGGAGFLGALAGAWALVYTTEAQSRDLAVDIHHVRTNAKTEDLAPAAPAELEAHLHEVKRANVLPYSAEAELDNPFVGSGAKVRDTGWQPIDVSRPADDPSGGGKLTIIDFDAVDLHTYVAREMEKIAGLDGLRANNRLYVIGSHVQYLGPELLPDPLGRPRARIDKGLVQAGLLNPGAGMRTYLSLERVGEGGRAIVSMYLRARVQHPSLTWEVTACVLPPVGPRFSRVDRLPLGGAERWWSLVAYTTGGFWPALRGATGRIRRRSAERNRQERALDKRRKGITKRNELYDYGAINSVREWIGDNDQMGHSERTDARDFLYRLQGGVLTATERFLKAHNVDTSSFDAAQQSIITQTYTVNGNVTGPSNFGNNGQIAQYGQQPQAQPPAGQGGAAHP
ncbi:hypothetical protein [Streptomyces sp. NBC_01465]|uniref:hypothetical protein n=1 Tax=Streptomyces sp. NBC_01465 TaxID=2903878 RepID=UPI002E35F3D3|nr:hypothetical protein [Streptomyces sp. NBC_01465]